MPSSESSLDLDVAGPLDDEHGHELAALPGEDYYDAVEIELADDGLSTISLDGREPSAIERSRAERLVEFLRTVLPKITDDADAGQLLYDLGELLAHPLGDSLGALAAMRDALWRQPQALHIARGYRKAAQRAGAWNDLVAALESEGRSTSVPSYRAALDVERAAILEQRLGNVQAARAALESALEADPACVPGLVALERLCVRDNQPSEAAKFAAKLADVVSDPAIRAEHGVRAARWLLRAGDVAGALARASDARVHAPNSESVLFTLEHIHSTRGSFAELAALRQEQIRLGICSEVAGWLDVAIIARTRLADLPLATAAFSKLAEVAGGDLRGFALGELSTLFEQSQQWTQVVETDTERVSLEPTPTGRAMLWHRIGRVTETKLGEGDKALEAFERALGEDPSFLPALEAKGRLLLRQGDRTRLVEMHRRQGNAAKTAEQQAQGLRRLGELLVQDAVTAREGVAALQKTRDLCPGDLFSFILLERVFLVSESWTELAALYEEQLTYPTTAPTRSWLLTQLGQVLGDRLGDLARSVTFLKQAAEYDVPGPRPFLWRLAQLLEGTGELGPLADVLEAILRHTDNPIEAANLCERLAYVHERRGAFDDAVAAYRRAVALSPEGHPVHAAAGRTFLRSGRYRELAEVFDGAGRSGPAAERATSLRKAADVYSHYLGEPDQALSRLREASALAPHDGVIAQALRAELGRRDLWAELGTHLAVDEPTPSSLLRRALCAEAVQNDEVALELYQRALSMGQDAAVGPTSRMLLKHERWTELDHLVGSTPRLPSAASHRAYRILQIGSLASNNERPVGTDGETEADLDRALGLVESLDKNAISIPIAMDLVRLSSGRPRKCLHWLELLTDRTSDPLCTAALAAQRADCFDALGEEDEALVTRLQILDAQPREPVTSVRVELALERNKDRISLTDLLRQPAADPLLAASMLASLGATLEELGSTREAADALERSRALEGAHVSRRTLFSLCRLYRALEDEQKWSDSVSSLAATFPPGPERGSCLRTLAAGLAGDGPSERRVRGLEAALQSHPLDYEALSELSQLSQEPSERARLIDPLLRAFRAEQRSDVAASLGTHLGRLLISEGRIATAMETLDRVFSLRAHDLPGLMLLTVVQEMQRNWKEALATLERIVSHEQADSWTRIEALRRMATIQIGCLNDRDSAAMTIGRLATMGDDSIATLRARGELEERIDDLRAARATVTKLIDRQDLSEPERNELLFRLASLEEQVTGDAETAIETLSRVTSGQHQQAAATRLLELADRTGRWDLVARSLETVLARSHALDKTTELEIRRKVADLLAGPLMKPEQAIPHFERIVELDPHDVRTLEHLASVQGSHDPRKAIAYHRALLRVQPERVVCYRALRKLFLEIGDVDAAFCAEAVLEGLGVATEEERYFYRQRGSSVMKNPALPPASLSPEDLRLMGPDADTMALLAALRPLLQRVFPIDYAGYGIDPRSPPASGALADTATEMGRILGAPTVRLYVIPARLGPAVEPDDPPVLIVSRSFEESARREQRFVLGSLFGRVLFDGFVGAFGNLHPPDGNHVDHLLLAVRNVVFGGTAASTHPIVQDIERRIAPWIDADLRSRLLNALERLPDSGARLSGALLQSRSTEVAASVGMLLCEDPAVAIGGMRSNRTMFAPSDAELIQGLPRTVLASVAFAVSEAHATLRKRLGIGVSP